MDRFLGMLIVSAFACLVVDGTITLAVWMWKHQGPGPSIGSVVGIAVFLYMFIHWLVSDTKPQRTK